MLLIDGAPLRTNSFKVESLLSLYPDLKKRSESFAQMPVRGVDDPRKVLYVGQKEYAILSNTDARFNLVGSDDATTCHILVAKSSLSGTICLAHLDSADETCVYNMLEKYVNQLETNEEIDVYLIGGYQDENDLSESLLNEILTLLNDWPGKLHLVMACVGPLNTTFKNGDPVPLVYGAAADIHSGQVFPALFQAEIRGPLPALRSARFLSSEPMLPNVYNASMGCFEIQPFYYDPPRHLYRLLQQSPSFFAKHFSTSPKAEPPHFGWHIKECLQFVYEHPDPLRTVFKQNESVYCKLNEEGHWSMFYPKKL